jgi:phage recombination protein Bet
MTEIATVGPSSGALALRADQHHFTDEQSAALAQIGVAEAPAGDLSVFMHVAQRTGLDPFSRQIYMISRYDSQAGRNRWTIQTGIDGFRIIAGRSGVYRGQVGPEWCGEDGVWRDVWLAPTAPLAARVGVIRSDFDQPIYGVAMFREYAQTKKGGDLTSMWASKGALMIAKCAEALALRKAFPNDLAGLMTPEETDRDDLPRRGRSSAVVDAEPVTAAELTGGTPVPAGSDVDARMTNDQQKKLFACIRDAGIENRNEWASQLLGRDITSFGQLSIADASHLIDAVERGLAAMNDDPGAEQ